MLIARQTPRWSCVAGGQQPGAMPDRVCLQIDTISRIRSASKIRAENQSMTPNEELRLSTLAEIVGKEAVHKFAFYDEVNYDALVLFRVRENEQGRPVANNYIVTAYQKEIV